jgi:hypothetical protein
MGSLGLLHLTWLLKKLDPRRYYPRKKKKFLVKMDKIIGKKDNRRQAFLKAAGSHYVESCVCHYLNSFYKSTYLLVQ